MLKLAETSIKFLACRYFILARNTEA